MLEPIAAECVAKLARKILLCGDDVPMIVVLLLLHPAVGCSGARAVKRDVSRSLTWRDPL